MYIGGFQKNTLIDFPGTLACAVFTQGCNLICPYCHNPELVVSHLNAEARLYDENKIFSFLETRRKFLDGVVITGGEPTLQKDLITFCNIIKAMGFKIKIDTNGTRPGVLEELLKNSLVDYIAMDIKTSLENYNSVTSGKFDTTIILRSIGLLMQHAPDYEFRTTCSKPFVNSEKIEDIGKMITGAKRFIFQKCSKNVKMLSPAYPGSGSDFF